MTMNKLTWTLALTLTTALGGVALAQPDPTTGGGTGDPMNPQPPVTTPPENTGTGTTTAPAPEAPPPMADPSGYRPDDAIVFGIGAGYVVPGPLDMLTTYSVRVRFMSGIILEPRVILGNNSQSTDDGNGNSTSVSSTTLAAGVALHAPLIKRGKFDFEILGLGGFRTVSSPLQGGADGDTQRATDLTLGYGIGVAWWISPHFQLSTAATNTLVSFTRNSNSVNDATTSSKDLGLVFDPQVTVMLHIYN